MITAQASDDHAKLLTTMLVTSCYSAPLIVSDVGDIESFPDSSSRVELTPSPHTSSGVSYRGSIT